MILILTIVLYYIVSLVSAQAPAATINVGGTSNLVIRLRQKFYTVQNISRVNPADNWSFTRPLDGSSSNTGCSHLGDVTFRLQIGNSPTNKTWTTYTTINQGAAVVPLSATAPVLASQDITQLLASSGRDPFPFTAVRNYELSSDGKALVLSLKITSKVTYPVRIGGFGFALPESDSDPPAGLESMVWADPHIGGQHGFVEFVRCVDDEATLLVTPNDHSTSPLENWRPMLEDRANSEAFEWSCITGAWAEDWANNAQSPYLTISAALTRLYPPFATNPQTPWPSCDGKSTMPKNSAAKNPWNVPTYKVVNAGESLTFSLRLQSITGGPRGRNAALQSMGEPVIHGIPGYVLSTDLKSAALLVKPPTGTTTSGVTAQSVDGGQIMVGTPSKTPGGYDSFPLTASGRGRVTVSITYSDKTVSTVHYLVLPPFSTQVSRLGNFFANTAWLPRNYVDPFGRSASVMPWDRSLCGSAPCGHILNDARAYDVGLSDDAGAGNPLGFASKVRHAPVAAEVSRVDDYIQYTLYGIKTDTAKAPFRSLQIRPGDSGTVDGIRMTLFYYDKDLNDHNSGHFDWGYTEADKCHLPFGSPVWCMTEDMADQTYRAFNYPHQVATYWAMYHVARNHDKITTRMPWQWYLERAAKTIIAVGAPTTGVMDGTVFREILDILKIEGASNTTMSGWERTINSNMQSRQRRFASQKYPYGSEFGFDTTGQEEVVVWNLYYGDSTHAKQTVDHILSYMRSSPTWAYNGGSRSWGDIGNNGKYLTTYGTSQYDRGNMHYRSGLNMIPLIEWYRANPDELFLLEISMGAIAGQMANIDQNGAPSMMFHVLPHVMDFDPHSGDYGLGFFGHSLETGSYYVEDSDLGKLCFLCNLGTSGSSVVITPADSYSLNVFLEPIALYIQTDAGTISQVLYDSGSSSVTITYAAVSNPTYSAARFRMTKTSTARPGNQFSVSGATSSRGGYVLPSSSGTVKITWS